MNKKIDEFSLLHFIQFFILGLIIKDNYKLAFIIRFPVPKFPEKLF